MPCSNLAIMQANCARLALPWGLSLPSVVPLIMPFSTAHSMDSRANALTLASSHIEPEGWETTYTASWVFGTFLKSLFSNFGILGTWLIAIFCAVFVTMAFHPKRKCIYFNELFIITMYFQVIFQGVFYFRQSYRGGNLYLILSVLFYFVFKHLSEKSNNKLVKL